MNNSTMETKKAMDTLEKTFDGTIKDFNNGSIDKAAARNKADGQIKLFVNFGFIDSDDAQDLFDGFCVRLNKSAKRKAAAK